MGAVLPMPVFLILMLGLAAFIIVAYGTAVSSGSLGSRARQWLRGVGYFALGAVTLFGVLYFLGCTGWPAHAVMVVFFLGLFSIEFLSLRGAAFFLVALAAFAVVLGAVYIGGWGVVVLPALLTVPVAVLAGVLRSRIGEKAVRRWKVCRRRRARRWNGGEKTRRLLGSDNSPAAHWERSRSNETGLALRAKGLLYRVP